MKRCVYYAEVISVLMCVFVVSQFDLYVTKRNYLCVTCHALSHIPNTSLRCSNQPLWKLNLMTGVNTTKQQTGKIKNKKSNLVELNKVWKQPQMLWKKRCSYKQHFWKGSFQSKFLKIYIFKKLVFSKVALSCSWKFQERRKKPVKNTIFINFFIR